MKILADEAGFSQFYYKTRRIEKIVTKLRTLCSIKSNVLARINKAQRLRHSVENTPLSLGGIRCGTRHRATNAIFKKVKNTLAPDIQKRLSNFASDLLKSGKVRKEEFVKKSF